MRLAIGIVFCVLALSCTREKGTLKSRLVKSEKVATQFYGTSSDSTKLIIWYLEVWDYYGESTEDTYEPFSFNLYGDEYYGNSQEAQYSCLIDSMIVGPGNYTFPFDIGHPCISDSTNYQRRILLQEYHLDSLNYSIPEGYYYNYTDTYGTPISAFDSLGYEKDF